MLTNGNEVSTIMHYFVDSTLRHLVKDSDKERGRRESASRNCSQDQPTSSFGATNLGACLHSLKIWNFDP